MKIVRSRNSQVTVTVPVLGGYRAHFSGHHAAVPDEVAHALVGMGGGFYEIRAEDVADALAQRADMTRPARVLVIRDMGLGDVLLVTPLVRRLHLDHGAMVAVMTKRVYGCLFQGSPFVSQVLPVEEDTGRRGGFDLVIDLRFVVENAESSGRYRHRADAFADYADIALTAAERTPDYFPAACEHDAAHDLLTEAGAFAPATEGGPPPAGVVAYAWRSSTSNRNWSDATHRAVIAALTRAGYRVVILDHERISPEKAGVGAQAMRCGAVINLSGRLSLREAAAVMAECDAAIAPDTGLFHLAAAVGTPTVTYFGPMPVAERAAHRVLEVVNEGSAGSACALFPCRTYTCLNRDADKQARCLAVDPAAVVRAVESAIERGLQGRIAETNASAHTVLDLMAKIFEKEPSPDADSDTEPEDHAPAVEPTEADGDPLTITGGREERLRGRRRTYRCGPAPYNPVHDPELGGG